MKTFRCTCGNRLHFENSRCLNCGKRLGFLPGERRLAPLVPADGGLWRPDGADTLWRLCANYAQHEVCNWLVPHDDPQPLCRACRLNRVIPNLDTPRNRTLWYRVESAKRRLIYGLDRLGLPLVGRDRDPQAGLAFEFLEGPAGGEFTDAFDGPCQVLTGHAAGTITINLAEADPSAREAMRERMGELYRTLLGHFRHEIGHYYWDRLVLPGRWLEPFRALFGDERGDYAEALRRYYADGPAPGWGGSHVSAYAAAHPWEDWAETFAHYLHILDTVETAEDYGFALRGRLPRSPLVLPAQADVAEEAFSELLGEWGELTTVLNDLNRSMGLTDAYPFVVAGVAAEKLFFVHRVVRAAGG